MHILYGATIVGLAYWVSFSEAKLNRVASIERAANRMVVERDMHYTPSGFVQATLAFLEKNKDLYPDTYQRALKMCERYKCDQPGNDLDMITLAYAMQGLLTGLATIDSRS